MRTLDIFAPEQSPPAQRYYRLTPGAPAIELADAKSFLRVDFNDDDADIQRFINAAIGRLDGSGRERDGLLGKALTNQTWILEAEGPDCGRIAIEHGIVQSITKVEAMSSGTYVTWASTNYRLGFRDNKAFLTPVSGQSFPPHDCREDAFKITYLCGYGPAATDVPGDLIEAMLMHVGHLYENRGLVADAGGSSNVLPLGYMDLIELHRVIPLV